MTVLEKVKLLCKERHITVKKLEEDLSLSRGAVYKWKDSRPNAETLYALSKYFGVQTTFFFDDEYERDVLVLNENQAILLETFTRLSSDTQQRLLTYVKMLEEMERSNASL